MPYVVFIKSNSGKVPVIQFVDALAYMLLIYPYKVSYPMSLFSIAEHLPYNNNIFVSSNALVFYNDISVYSSMPYLVYILDTLDYND